MFLLNRLNNKKRYISFKAGLARVRLNFDLNDKRALNKQSEKRKNCVLEKHYSSVDLQKSQQHDIPTFYVTAVIHITSRKYKRGNSLTAFVYSS